MLVTLTNPNVLKLPEWQAFFQRAFKKSPWADTVGNLDILENLIKNTNLSWVIHTAAGRPLGFGVIAFPVDPLDPNPQVIHIYSQPPAANKRLLVEGIVDKIRERGYTKFLAVNYTGKPDKVWMRALKPRKWTVKPVGSIMEFNCG